MLAPCLRFFPLRDFNLLAFTILTILCGFWAESSQAARRGTPTLVDADLEGGLGDLLALTLAVRNPHLDVVGVVTTSSPGSERARAISHWLEFLDRPDIKIGGGGRAAK